MSSGNQSTTGTAIFGGSAGPCWDNKLVNQVRNWSYNSMMSYNYVNISIYISKNKQTVFNKVEGSWFYDLSEPVNSSALIELPRATPTQMNSV